MKLEFSKQHRVVLEDMILQGLKEHFFDWKFNAWIDKQFCVVRIQGEFGHTEKSHNYFTIHDDDCALCQALPHLDPVDVLVELDTREDGLILITKTWQEFHASCKAATRAARGHLERAWTIDAGRTLAEAHAKRAPKDPLPWHDRDKLIALYKDDLGKRAIPEPKWGGLLDLLQSAAAERWRELRMAAVPAEGA